jgi:hypothetical protein
MRGLAVPELSSTFNASPDGVLTSEVGVITGELELRSSCTDTGDVHLEIRYSGARDWYRLPGDGAHLHDPRDLDALHRVLVAVLTRPSATPR